MCCSPRTEDTKVKRPSTRVEVCAEPKPIHAEPHADAPEGSAVTVKVEAPEASSCASQGESRRGEETEAQSGTTRICRRAPREQRGRTIEREVRVLCERTRRPMCTGSEASSWAG